MSICRYAPFREQQRMEKWQNQMLLKLVQLVLSQKLLPHLYLRWRATFSCERQKWWYQVPSDPGLSESGTSGGRSGSRKGLIHVLHVLKAPEFQLRVCLLQGLKCSDSWRLLYLLLLEDICVLPQAQVTEQLRQVWAFQRRVQAAAVAAI